MNKPKIIEYIDFRAYLKDFFDYKKEKTPKFSHRKLAASLSLASPSFMAEVIKGKKNLSKKIILKLQDILQFTEREFRYFEILVQFNQSKSMEEKNHYFTQLSKFRGSRAKTINENQYKFYTKWYYSAVWTYFGYNTNERDPAKIASEIFPPISPKQVNESINLLLHLKLIKKMANGYAATENHIVTENPFRGMVASQYNRLFMEMAKNALDTVPGRSRQYHVLMFSISQKGFQSIKERIRSFQEELRDIIERDQAEDRIYTLCMQLFPNSKNH
jgi:uncharacterized protein (TIGR02147 family)